MSLYIKGRAVEAMFRYDGDLIASTGAFYVPEWAERLYKNGYLYYAACEDSPSELFYKTEVGAIHVPVGSYVFKRCERDSLIILTEDEVDRGLSFIDDHYTNKLKIAESRIDTLKKVNNDLNDRLRKYEWGNEVMKRMIEGAIK